MTSAPSNIRHGFRRADDHATWQLSRLGDYAPRQVRTGKPLPFNDSRHLQAHQFLVDEAYLLDAQQYDEWLDGLTEDILYFMPVRVTTALGAGYDTAPAMAHFDENKYSLSRRVERFRTEHAWTEDPPSRLRHHITNVRTFASDDDAHLIVESAELLFRSRGDVNDAALVSCGREDLLRFEDDRWKLARRTIMVDESVLRMQNLAVFL
ncbi:3-phenylpropionate/cinnamic acid dioxygenase subunit beta [Mycobacterium sp. DBP42]|jgi:phthalate 3,4-dioxygenase beta subunit|uniref:3-phenylpropionate/cinnamic acid dioxygenase subunit beta n=1 Tax=Mycobacterium sp. DBP42 TaxID=2545267 RepID=UPI00110CABE6|nr:3-phenylpropionate/cinnamic acid dioxygenase subunit beta [Mycobacterium sp. DBP42]TMS52435.1 3-phenylpropionate/cinnamic acid dioxygenase subunit beta [Mycobacterium sp. DBP42]